MEIVKRLRLSSNEKFVKYIEICNYVDINQFSSLCQQLRKVYGLLNNRFKLVASQIIIKIFIDFFMDCVCI